MMQGYIVKQVQVMMRAMRTKDITFTTAVAIAFELYTIERGAFTHSSTEGILDKN